MLKKLLCLIISLCCMGSAAQACEEHAKSGMSISGEYGAEFDGKAGMEIKFADFYVLVQNDSPLTDKEVERNRKLEQQRVDGGYNTVKYNFRVMDSSNKKIAQLKMQQFPYSSAGFKHEGKDYTIIPSAKNMNGEARYFSVHEGTIEQVREGQKTDV